MLNLLSTDRLELTTDAAVTVDVTTAWVDRVLATADDTPGRTKALISTATTAIIAEAPASGTVRNVRYMAARNRGASPVGVTVQHWTSGTIAQLISVTLNAGATLSFTDQSGFILKDPQPLAVPTWYGKLASPVGASNPDVLMREWQNAGHINPTPTNITTSIARCASFRLPAELVVNRIRFYGIGATTNVYRTALYRYSDLARLTSELAFSTVANTWGSVTTGGVTLDPGVLYFIAVSVNATGTTAGIASIGTTTTAAIGQVQSTPGGLPGNLSLGAGFQSSFWFQFAVTTGALPNPAATLALPAVWTGGFPVFFLDNNSS